MSAAVQNIEEINLQHGNLNQFYNEKVSRRELKEFEQIVESEVQETLFCVDSLVEQKKYGAAQEILTDVFNLPLTFNQKLRLKKRLKELKTAF